MSKPGEAKHRAVARANPWTKPRNTKMRVASVSETMKPVSSQHTTAWLRWVLRGDEGQRDAKDELGTWENPSGAHGVSRAQRACQRSKKLGCCRWEVGEAHSSDETGESPWSEGALVTGKLTQAVTRSDWLTERRPTTGRSTSQRWSAPLAKRAKLGCQAKRLGPTRRACLVEETPVGASRAVNLSAKAGCGKSARPV